MSDILQLIILGAIWGGTFMFLRIGVPEFGPAPLIMLRLALGTLMLLPFLWRDRTHFSLRRWPMLALVGVLNSGLPFLLFAWAAERAPAGVGAITNGMTALCAALVGFLFFGERLRTQQSVALVVGFIGVIVLASSRIEGMSIGWASLAGALGSLMYGLGLHMARRYLQGLPSAALAAATLGCSTLLTLPLAIATWPDHPVSALSWFSAAALGIVGTGIGFVMYYRLLERIGPLRTSTVTYLIPPFGVAWAWLFINEPATPKMVIACALILGSVAWSQRRA